MSSINKKAVDVVFKDGDTQIKGFLNNQELNEAIQVLVDQMKKYPPGGIDNVSFQHKGHEGITISLKWEQGDIFVYIETEKEIPDNL